MKTLSEAIRELLNIFPELTTEEKLERAKTTIKELETFTVGVLVGQGMSYDTAVKTVRRLED